MLGRIACALVLLFFVSACAPTLAGVTERGGMVLHVRNLNMDQAVATADTHCKQFNRTARINQLEIWTNTLSFDCVL